MHRARGNNSDQSTIIATPQAAVTPLKLSIFSPPARTGRIAREVQVTTREANA